MRHHLVKEGALEEAGAGLLASSALASTYVGSSPLTGTFEGSRGFGIAFRRQATAEVIKRFPFVAQFLALVQDSRSSRKLWHPFERAWQALTLGAPNAYYLNLLVIDAGSGIAAHVDATLRSWVPEVLPQWVSVIQMQRPENATGGALKLHQGRRTVAEVIAAPGTLVHFRGDLVHEVTPLQSESGIPRVSLVCEHYALTKEQLGRVPHIEVRSKSRFAHVLSTIKGKPEFELE